MTHRVTVRTRTADRGPPDNEGIKILEAEQIGPNQSLLPNGNLLCKAVPIARVGWMVYGDGETPIKVDPATGIAHVHRDAETLFSVDCIGSFMGVAVVDEHPDEDVTPDNWKKLAQGFVTNNVYQGEGADSDILLADVIITDAALIKLVQAGKREVSCGYDADYKQTGPGQGKQLNIIGNHLALVEKGRCGPRCAIGDRAHQPKENQMATRTVLKGPAQRRKVLDLRRKVLDAEQAVAEAEEGEEGMSEDEAGTGEGGTHVHIHTSGGAMAKSDDEGEEDPGEARLKKLETGLAAVSDAIGSLTEAFRTAGGGSKADDAEEEEDDKKKKPKAEDDESEEEDDKKKPKDKAKDGEEEDDKDEKGKARDSVALQTSYTELGSKAELLVPGFRMPTFDGKAKRKTTMDAMCGARRRAIDLACSTKDGFKLISSINGGKEPTLDSMSCVEVATLFNAATGAKALLNNRSSTGDSGTAGKPVQVTPPNVVTLDTINKANAEFWARNEQRA